MLFDRWFSVYHDAHPGTIVQFDAVGSGEGIRRFIGRDLKDGEAVDFGASDSAMSDAQLAQASAPTVMVPITGGCVVLAYNLPSVHGELKLSRSAYLGIFRGEVATWRDSRITRTNPGFDLPDSAIGRIVRQESSGTTFALANHLAAIDEGWARQHPPATSITWPGDAIRGKGNEGVAGLIHISPGSIGYVGYEFAKRLQLAVASLENREGQFVAPSAQSCSAGLASVKLPGNLRAFVPDPAGAGSYPIVTFSWILFRKSDPDGPRAAALRDLLTWALQDGQAYAAELGYVPLPPSVRPSRWRR